MGCMKNFNALANTLKDNSGFVSYFGLFFIVLISLIFITTGFLRFTIDARADFRYFCFNDLHQVQLTLIEHENRILAINPLANALRIRLRMLYAQLAVAIASKNPPLVAQITQLIMQTKQNQRSLRTQQQLLFSFAHSLAQYQLIKAYNDFTTKSRRRNSAWSEILNISNSIFLNTFRPRMAISPDNPSDIAPIYQLDPDFENQQRISAVWAVWFFAKPDFQTLIKTNQKWSLKCASEPQNRQSLKPLVTADRPL